ncbi:MAG: family 2A encapsulin nanocompartment cargo protein cysteine desulfurase [Mucilaginibacter sp.]
MSTNTNPEGFLDIRELEKLANQFFKSSSGEIPVNPVISPVVYTDYRPSIDRPDTIAGANGLPVSLYNHTPQSIPVAGAGASPSAVTQGNVIDLKDPQTSFDDPALNNASAKENVTGFSLSGTELLTDNFKQLPYHHEQSFEKDLQTALNQIVTFPHTLQIPLKPDGRMPEPSYYFLKKLPEEFTAGRAQGASGIITPSFDVNIVRRDFPILNETVNGKPLVWLDNAATTQKPKQVIDRISYFYEHENSNIHRAAHELAARATDAYEGARKKVQQFLNAASVNEIIFVRGATEAINLVAKSWGEQNLQAGDEIIISHLEHHANIVPWQQLAAKKNLKIKVIPVDDDGQLILDEYVKLLGPKTKLVAFTQVSNALGTVTPAAQIVKLGHLAGAKVLVDGAQSVSHMPVDVRALDADWFVFSGHKVFAPTGIGVLYGKEDLLNETPPWQGGGNMIVDVTFEETKYHNAPGRFEAGTGNIADAVGLGAAIDYVTRIGMQAISQYEHYLLVHATQLLKDVKGLRLIGTAPDKASVLSFVLDGYKTEEVGAELNKEGIAVRSGHHCAQPILRRFGLESTVRPSLAFYNTCAEVDLLAETLHALKR